MSPDGCALGQTIAVSLVLAVAGGCVHEAAHPVYEPDPDSESVAAIPPEPPRAGVPVAAREMEVRITRISVQQSWAFDAAGRPLRPVTPIYRFDVGLVNHSPTALRLDQSAVGGAVCSGVLATAGGDRVTIIAPFRATHPFRALDSVVVGPGKTADFSFYLMPGTRLTVGGRTVGAGPEVGPLTYSINWEWVPGPPLDFAKGPDGEVRVIALPQPQEEPWFFRGGGETVIEAAPCAQPRSANGAD